MSAHDEENDVGIGPAEMLLLSLGGCTSYDVVNILTKKRQKLTGLEVVVTGEQAEEPPWPYLKIHVLYRLRGKGLREKAVRDAIELSETKYCSVAATLRPSVEITYDYTIEQED
jgi:putative redox protein